jgi:hypothetical protein
MRTTPALLIVFAFASGILLFQLSGVGALFGVGDPTSDLQSGERFQEEGNETVLEEEGDQFQPDTRGSDNLVGFIISSVGIVFSYVQLVVLFPIELRNLGLPRYAAIPIGLLTQTLVVFGVVEFASGRVWS